MTKTVMTLEPHPLARTFPPMEVEDFNKLKHDIRENGLREPVVLYEGKILDGVHRYEACCDLGITPKTIPYEGIDPLAYVISMNIHRRHLSPEKKREIIAELLKANPQLSDRAIAAQAKVSHHTVADVREATGQSAQLETREGLDRKKRKVLRTKSKPSAMKQAKQLEAFKETWEGFNDYQQHSFVKAFRDQIKELLDNIEAESEAAEKEDMAA